MRDAVGSLRTEIAAPDTGSLQGDFAALSAVVARRASEAGALMLLPRLLADAAGDPEMHAIFTSQLVEPRRQAVRVMLERARARGEIRSDVDLEVAIDMIVGPVIYRLLIAAGELPAAVALAPRVLEPAIAGLAPRPA